MPDHAAPKASEPVIRDDIYNLDTAAARCRVKREQILDWIDMGLRCFPLGNALQYRARDYIILEEWLLDFFRMRGTVTELGKKSLAAQKRRMPKPSGVTEDQPLGPRPY
jgi:hypothetical protein